MCRSKFWIPALPATSEEWIALSDMPRYWMYCIDILDFYIQFNWPHRSSPGMAGVRSEKDWSVAPLTRCQDVFMIYHLTSIVREIVTAIVGDSLVLGSRGCRALGCHHSRQHQTETQNTVYSGLHQVSVLLAFTVMTQDLQCGLSPASRVSHFVALIHTAQYLYRDNACPGPVTSQRVCCSSSHAGSILRLRGIRLVEADFMCDHEFSHPSRTPVSFLD